MGMDQMEDNSRILIEMKRVWGSYRSKGTKIGVIAALQNFETFKMILRRITGFCIESK